MRTRLLQLARVGHEAVGQLRGALRRVLHPQLALDRVKARPLRLGDVVGAGVDARVEVAEALGHGLDALVGHTRLRVRAPGGGDVAAGQRGAQRPDAGHQRSGLALEEGPVAVRPLAAAPGASAAAARAPVTVSEASSCSAAGAAQRVAAGLEGEREALGQAVGDVLDLGQRPAALDDLVLGRPRRALVGDDEGRRAGGELQRRRRAPRVGDRHVDGPPAAAAAGDRRGGLLAAAERADEQDDRRRHARRRPATRRAHARAHGVGREDDGSIGIA